MKFRLILVLALLVNFVSSSQEIITIEPPDAKGTANLDLLHLIKEDNDLVAVWLHRPVALVMGYDDEERRGKVYKKTGECTGQSYNFGGKVISECDPDKSIANATSLYIVVKQKIGSDGKSLGIKSVTPIALRYVKKDSTYFAYFKEQNPFLQDLKVKITNNLAGLSEIKTLNAAEQEILTKIFIQQYEFVNNMPSSAPADPYDKMVKDYLTFKESLGSWPEIPDNHAFKKMYEIGTKKYMLSRDKRYKNEKGSVFYVVDITTPKKPVLIDSTFSADEASLDENVMVVDNKMQPCGMLFNYTLEKLQEGKDREYSRQVIYVGADNKVIKTIFKTGHSKGGAYSACSIKYAFKFNDSIFFESSHLRKKMPPAIESFILTEKGITKTTPADTSKPFLKEKMQNIGSGAVQNTFVHGDDFLVPVNLYRTPRQTIVFYQAKEIIPAGTTQGYNVNKDYGIPSMSVFNDFQLTSTARFFYPYTGDKPIRASLAYKSNSATYFLLGFYGPSVIVKVNGATGELSEIKSHDAATGFYYYRPLSKTFFAITDNSLYLVQKDSKNKFRLIKVE